MKTLLLSTCTALVVVCSGAAMAADMAIKAAPVVAPVKAPWTGCGLGFSVGGVWGDAWKALPTPLIGGNTYQSAYALSGQLAGAQLYCDYQTGPVVLGLQGDYAWTNLDGNGVTASNAVGQWQTKLESISGAGGRVGLVAGSALVYVRAQAVWMRQEQTLFPVGAAAQQITDTRAGYGIGAGLEYMIAPVLTARIEYNYDDFGTKNYAWTGPATPVGDRTRFHIMKLGVNYKFW